MIDADNVTAVSAFPWCTLRTCGRSTPVLRYGYRNTLAGRIMPISIRLPEAIEERLTRLAAATGRSKTWYVTEAICEHLDDLEDLYLAEQRLIELRAGRNKTSTLKEVMKRDGMEG